MTFTEKINDGIITDEKSQEYMNYIENNVLPSNIYENCIKNTKLPNVNRYNLNDEPEIINNYMPCNEIIIRKHSTEYFKEKEKDIGESIIIKGNKYKNCRPQSEYCLHCNILLNIIERNFFCIIYPYENGVWDTYIDKNKLQRSKKKFDKYDGVTVYRNNEYLKVPYSFSIIRNIHYTGSQNINYIYECYKILRKYLSDKYNINNTMFLLRQQIFCDVNGIKYREHQHAWLQVLEPDWNKYNKYFDVDTVENYNRKNKIIYDSKSNKIIHKIEYDRNGKQIKLKVKNELQPYKNDIVGGPYTNINDIQTFFKDHKLYNKSYYIFINHNENGDSIKISYEIE